MNNVHLFKQHCLNGELFQAQLLYSISSHDFDELITTRFIKLIAARGHMDTTRWLQDIYESTRPEQTTV